MSRGHPWTPEEIERVEFLVGDVPPQLLVVCYNNWAKWHGKPTRTLKAIKHICSDLGVSIIPDGKWVRTSCIARMLGISIHAPQYWVERGLILYKQARPKTPVYIQRSDIRKLAEKSPQLFAGVSYDRLFSLLEDEDLCEYIAANYPVRKMNFKPIHPTKRVRCVELDCVFNTVSEAAKSVYVTHQVLTRAIQKGWRAGGYTWEEAS